MRQLAALLAGVCLAAAAAPIDAQQAVAQPVTPRTVVLNSSLKSPWGAD